MRKVLYFAGMALVAASVLVACEKDPGEDNGNGNGGDVVRLAIPQPSFTDTTETSVTVAWAAVENAASYTYMLNNEENTTTETSVVIDVPEAGEYSFRVKSVPAEGSTEFAESQWSSTITYEYKGEITDPSDDLAAWVGTYSLVSTQALNVSAGANPTLTDEPVTIDEIIIAPSESPDYLYIYGLSGLGADWPCIGAAITDEAGNVGLCLLGDAMEFSVGTGGENGEYKLYWYGLYQSDNDPSSIAWVIGMQWTFAFFGSPDGEVTSLAATGYFDEAGTDTFKVVGTDIFSQASDGIILYYETATLPAGELTLTRTGDYTPSSVASRASRNLPVFPAGNMVYRRAL